MKKVISFSGGRTSAYLLNLFKNDPEAHFVFMDTGAEHPATYQFIKDIVKHWKIDLVCLRTVVNPVMNIGCTYKIISLDELKQDLEPWKAMLKKYGSPYYDSPFCTARMKTEPFEKYCNDKFGKGGFERWIGIRFDEPKRLPIEILKSLQLPVHTKASNQKKGFRYLAEISEFEKDDVLHWWKKQPFDLAITEHLGNCVFCIKKTINKVALAGKDEPEQLVKWVQVTEGPDVRSEGRKYNHHRMYRERLHASDIADLYKAHSRDELYGSLRSSKRFDSGSCTESCEAFSDRESVGGVV